MRLLGAPPNLDAIGATVVIDVGGRRRTRTVMPYGSYLSQSEAVLTFGLGAAERIDALSRALAGGRVVESPPPGVDRVLEIPGALRPGRREPAATASQSAPAR